MQYLLRAHARAKAKQHDLYVIIAVEGSAQNAALRYFNFFNQVCRREIGRIQRGFAVVCFSRYEVGHHRQTVGITIGGTLKLARKS